jgi:hypothetical protein
LRFGEAENWAKGFAVFMLRFAGIAVALQSAVQQTSRRKKERKKEKKICQLQRRR